MKTIKRTCDIKCARKDCRTASGPVTMMSDIKWSRNDDVGHQAGRSTSEYMVDGGKWYPELEHVLSAHMQ